VVNALSFLSSVRLILTDHSIKVPWLPYKEQDRLGVLNRLLLHSDAELSLCYGEGISVGENLDLEFD